MTPLPHKSGSVVVPVLPVVVVVVVVVFSPVVWVELVDPLALESVVPPLDVLDDGPAVAVVDVEVESDPVASAVLALIAAVVPGSLVVPEPVGAKHP